MNKGGDQPSVSVSIEGDLVHPCAHTHTHTRNTQTHTLDVVEAAECEQCEQWFICFRLMQRQEVI